ncbi:hypothetical protein HCJ28_02525 [Listeria sp. FSL L7-1434]|uniref:hypothetical protein n=1 Tax=Listeria cossartiae TaxID=2838249 RepID=UPI001627057A|nr:hypothetical protein [Listeria cossartiae]MBC1548815.1 hypothetical protein [Listeria cossartiae subsp. cossartiae]
MESYIQITNEAAVKMIVNGHCDELWVEKNGDIVRCDGRFLYVHEIPGLKFFVRLSDEK